MKYVFLVCACASILAVILICAFLFANGVPAIGKIGVFNFLLGRHGNREMICMESFPLFWKYLCNGRSHRHRCPIGLLTAIFMARFCPKIYLQIYEACSDLLAGIPSVVYGFFGMVVLVPFVRNFFGQTLGFGGNGSSMFTASVMLGIMILPTIISVGESSIRAVPNSYYEGSLALGATHERSVFCTIVPAAKSGIMAGIILGIGRAIGETMAVIMIAGNQPRMPKGIFEGVRTLTSNIVMEMGYATDLHREALIATAVVLFVFILIINLLFSLVKRRSANG